MENTWFTKIYMSVWKKHEKYVNNKIVAIRNAFYN
jgi:hypothetical protein